LLETTFAGEERPAVADPLVVAFHYAGVRQEICVSPEADFCVVSDTERGRLRASGRVGRVLDNHVNFVLRLHFSSGRSEAGVELDRRVRLGEFTDRGVGTIPPTYVLWYVWVRRGVDPVPTLAEVLRHWDANAVVAADYLGRLKAAARPAVPDLIDATKAEVPLGLRLAAVAALGEIGPAAEDAVPVLLEHLRNERPGQVRVAAASALWKIAKHSDATPTLIGALNDAEKGVQLEALDALHEIGVEAPMAGPALAGMLNDPDPQSRCRAAAALWATTQDTRAIDSLIDLLQSDEPGRSRVVESLGRIGYPHGHRATGAMVADLWSTHAGHRKYLAEALTRIDPDASQIVPLVLLTLREDDERGVTAPSGILARYGLTIIPALRDLLEQEDERARELALATLGAMGAAAIDTLATALRHRAPKVRRLAALYLRDLDADTTPAIPDLVRTLNDDDKEVRTNAAFTLMDIGPAAIPAVEQALNDTSPRTAELAERILRHIKAVEKMEDGNTERPSRGNEEH
jgi:HEAT repeat protein